ncbi:MAG: LpxI family protein, partial [Rubricella sp.]
MSGPGPLGIVAGRGALPRLVAVAMEAAARPVEIVTLAPLPEPWIGRFPHRTIPFEALGAIFEHFSAAGIRDICLAGAMERPTLDPTRFDPTLAALAPRLLPLLREGDDALLRALIEVFEARGFRIVAAHEIVPELVIGAGTLTVHAPSKADCEDIARGRAILGA